MVIFPSYVCFPKGIRKVILNSFMIPLLFVGRHGPCQEVAFRAELSEPWPAWLLAAFEDLRDDPLVSDLQPATCEMEMDGRPTQDQKKNMPIL